MPIKPLSLSLSGTYTGSMLVQHMAGYIDKDMAVNTRDFFDMGVKVDVYKRQSYTRFPFNRPKQESFGEPTCRQI